MTVYIGNFNEGHDYDQAKTFGPLVPLTRGQVSVFAVDRLTAEMAEGLRAFDPEKDYLLLSGHLHINAVAIAVLAAWHKHFNVLLFHAKTRKYLERTFTPPPQRRRTSP